MANFNSTFELGLKDMDVIETALRAMQAQSDQTPFDAKSISTVLGNLHNQKTFYRPTDQVYVGG